MVILFYSKKKEYGWLSNFYKSKHIIDGIEYPTNEHYYQSQKTDNVDFQRIIRIMLTPYMAMRAGRTLPKELFRPDWDKIKVDVMLKGLRAKFTQNPDLKQKLLDTGNEELHEDSPTDMFWGVKGQDMLGKLLMQVRDEIRRNVI